VDVGPEGYERRAKELMSTFNVDGPRVVATPYNPAWEIPPHSGTRSTSTCRVVEEMWPASEQQPGGNGGAETSHKVTDSTEHKAIPADGGSGPAEGVS